MRAENQVRRPPARFRNLLHENRSALPKLLDHVAVMHDLVVDVHGRAVGFQRQFHDVHRAHHACAEPPGTHAHQPLGPAPHFRILNGQRNPR